MTCIIQPITPDTRPHVVRQAAHHFTSHLVRSRDIPFDTSTLPGFVALHNNAVVGHITIATQPDTPTPEVEIITLVSDLENLGVGAALLNAAIQHARACHASRLFLTTSNDNLRALGFYQRRAFRIVAVHPGMIDRYRKLKPIPLLAPNGIPIRDEIELEHNLTAHPRSSP